MKNWKYKIAEDLKIDETNGYSLELPVAEGSSEITMNWMVLKIITGGQEMVKLSDGKVNV